VLIDNVLLPEKIILPETIHNKMILFNNYKKFFGQKLIVDIPSLELGHNIYWLQGENGSGKTTLMKSVAGLIPFEGSISLDGTDIRKHRTRYRELVNYAEAEPAFPGFLTGNDLVRFYTKTKKGNVQRVSSLIASFGIGDYIDNKIATYSSGMAKKLSLVLGFIGNPKLILLDEPLITLDVASVKTLQDMITSSYNEGVSFLITSHQELLNGLMTQIHNGPGSNIKPRNQEIRPFGKLTFNQLTD
jgi:ABC-2 type transport system ATP-binding protein